jgi:hypothetical protein
MKDPDQEEAKPEEKERKPEMKLELLPPVSFLGKNSKPIEPQTHTPEELKNDKHEVGTYFVSLTIG